MMPVPKKKKKIENFSFAMGMGNNWIDLDKEIIYHIQEYKEAMARGEKPRGIRMTSLRTDEELGYADEYTIEQRMKDPVPDPRYEAETPKEHRRNW